MEGTADANSRFMTYCIDPLCDQLQEEINRKRYGYEEWKRGNYLRVDSSSILHFDIFENAANVEKLIGSGAFTINDVRRAAGQPAILGTVGGRAFYDEKYFRNDGKHKSRRSRGRRPYRQRLNNTPLKKENRQRGRC